MCAGEDKAKFCLGAVRHADKKSAASSSYSSTEVGQNGRLIDTALLIQ